MKKFLYLSMTVLALLAFTGCSEDESVESTETTDEVVEDTIATDDETPEVAESVGANFTSVHEDFEYALYYDPSLLTLVDDVYEGGYEGGPSFDISSGGHITVMTGWIDSPGYKMHQLVNALYYEGYSDWPTETPEPIAIGDNEVYRFSSDYEGCVIEYGVVPGTNEALSIRVEACGEDDLEAAMEIFESLFEELTISQN
ncbi:MAG: hypothetical protein Q8P27_00315 [Candidatus Peregrinibacteria bacterium]|nr:hypothetical protein [Candidatus Peregrinibacteria bacterium]